MQNVQSQITSYQRKIASLENQLLKRRRTLLSLPKKYGYKDISGLIEALQSVRTAAGTQAVSGRKPRTSITAEMKGRTRSLVREGKTNRGIAQALGVSLQSVHNIKKQLGLVRTR